MPHSVKEMRKRLVGRTIVGFEARAFRDGRRKDLGKWVDRGPFAEAPPGGAITYDPVLILDDGTRVSFRVHETEIGEYGIDPCIEKSKPK